MSRVYKTIAPYSRWTTSCCGATLHEGCIAKFCPRCGEAVDWESPIEVDFQYKSLPYDGKVYSIAEFETDDKKRILRDECIIDGYTYIRKEEEGMEFKIGNDTYKLPWTLFEDIWRRVSNG